jgi:hypothetical protein
MFESSWFWLISISIWAGYFLAKSIYKKNWDAVWGWGWGLTCYWAFYIEKGFF